MPGKAYFDTVVIVHWHLVSCYRLNQICQELQVDKYILLMHQHSLIIICKTCASISWPSDRKIKCEIWQIWLSDPEDACFCSISDCNRKKEKEKIIWKKLSLNLEMIYPLPEKPSKNIQDGKDNGKLFQRKINLILW